MAWDEENRLSGVNDNGRIHQFTYDAAGERVIKSSGDSQNVAINGETAATIVQTDDYTGYVSPYFVISKGKFTKHYFEGAGRIVSKLGNGSFAQPLKLTAGGVNYGKLTAEQQKALDNYVKTLGVPPGPPTQQGIYATPEFTGDPYPSEALKPVEENQEPPEGWPRNPVFNAPGDVPGPPVQFGPPVEPTTVKGGEGFTGTGMPENDIFYFHPDHLGSTSYITTKNRSISQHVEFIAFGEVLFEEHSSSFSSPYLFNGKELDRETNLSYYGARYLDMKTSLWLNVDPLATYNPVFEDEFYFDGDHNGGVYYSGNLSPYIYCYQNPIKYIDPNGKQTEVTNKGTIFNANKNTKVDPLLRGVERTNEQSHIRTNTSIYNNALNQKQENNATHIYSHGWYTDGSTSSEGYSYLSIYYEKEKRHFAISNTQDLKNWLANNNVKSDFLSKKDHILILHGCRSAYGENSIAKTLSEENKNTGLVTVGATGNVLYNEKGEYMGTASNGTKNKGSWDVYKNGKIIKSFPWNWKPNSKDVKAAIDGK